MKPSRFRYVVPETIEAAIQARSQDDDSVVLAGGQSLVPTMNFRLSNPDLVIDLRKVRELDFVRVEGDRIHIGAMTRQRVLENNDEVFRANALIRATLENIAHPVIRNRGTIGGSLAHADPAAELPALCAALRGEFIVQGPAGRRTILARDFFEFIFTTSIQRDELLVEVILPCLDRGEGYGFLEFARRHGDYAVAGVAATLLLDSNGLISRVRLGACGIGTVPVVLEESESLLIGQKPSEKLFADAGEAARIHVSSADAPGVTAGYRQQVLAGIVHRVLTQALGRAEKN